jgi:transketolase
VTARVAVEAGVTNGWWHYVGPGGRVIGIDCFGQSAPAGELFEHYGFTVNHVVAAAKETLI